MSIRRQRKRDTGDRLARKIDRAIDRLHQRSRPAENGHILVNLGPKAMGLLRQLHKQGFYGVTIEGTAETLILEGLRARAPAPQK